MMGARQESWFYNQLTESQARGAAWRLIGSQTVFSRENESVAAGNINPLDYDAWDGYLANKNRTLQHLYQNNVSLHCPPQQVSGLTFSSDHKQHLHVRRLSHLSLIHI